MSLVLVVWARLVLSSTNRVSSVVRPTSEAKCPPISKTSRAEVALAWAHLEIKVAVSRNNIPCVIEFS